MKEQIEAVLKVAQECGDFLSVPALSDLAVLAEKFAKDAEGTDLELMAGPLLEVVQTYQKEAQAGREFIPKERVLIMCKKMLQELKVKPDSD